MRFANYKYKAKYSHNIGDYIQILTIDYLYGLMGIEKNDIIYIDLDELDSYDGPDVKLPVSMPLVRYYEHGFSGMFSDKINPVFFGLTMVKDTLDKDEVEYFKKCGIIGCRDERTYNTMRRYGIQAYLNGCLTCTLPKRESGSNKKKIYLIDAPADVEKYMPTEQIDLIERRTHQYSGELLPDHMQFARNQYKEYAENAALVVTSLLHAAVPCMALGIPVILAKSMVSYRFSWLEKLIRIYTPEVYSEIDWNPDAVDCESLKEWVKDVFIKRMNGKNADEGISYLHGYYMDRERNEYIVDGFIDIKDFIDKNWLDKTASYCYSIWGLTQFAQYTVDYIRHRYPNAVLNNVYDVREGLRFCDKDTLSPNKIAVKRDEIVFVTALGAVDEAERLFNEMGIQREQFCGVSRTI